MRIQYKTPSLSVLPDYPTCVSPRGEKHMCCKPARAPNSDLLYKHVLTSVRWVKSDIIR